MSISHNRILICDASYQPHHWACVEDAIVLKYKNLISHEMGDAAIFNGGVNRRTLERSHVDIGSILFLKEALKYDSRVPPLTNQNLFARDLNICGFCGRHYHESKLSRDHIIPVSKGGKNVWTNCVTSCKPCNHTKDDNLLQDAYDSDGEKMKLLYVPYVPSHVERLILQNRNIVADQMEFLKQMLPANSRLHQITKMITLDDIPDMKVKPVKRHFMSANEISAIKREQEIANSRQKRGTM